MARRGLRVVKSHAVSNEEYYRQCHANKVERARKSAEYTKSILHPHGGVDESKEDLVSSCATADVTIEHWRAPAQLVMDSMVSASSTARAFGVDMFSLSYRVSAVADTLVIDLFLKPALLLAFPSLTTEIENFTNSWSRLISERSAVLVQKSSAYQNFGRFFVDEFDRQVGVYDTEWGLQKKLIREYLKKDLNTEFHKAGKRPISDKDIARVEAVFSISGMAQRTLTPIPRDNPYTSEIARFVARYNEIKTAMKKYRDFLVASGPSDVEHILLHGCLLKTNDDATNNAGYGKALWNSAKIQFAQAEQEWSPEQRKEKFGLSSLPAYFYSVPFGLKKSGRPSKDGASFYSPKSLTSLWFTQYKNHKQDIEGKTVINTAMGKAVIRSEYGLDCSEDAIQSFFKGKGGFPERNSAVDSFGVLRTECEFVFPSDSLLDVNQQARVTNHGVDGYVVIQWGDKKSDEVAELRFTNFQLPRSIRRGSAKLVLDQEMRAKYRKATSQAERDEILGDVRNYLGDISFKKCADNKWKMSVNVQTTKSSAEPFRGDRSLVASVDVGCKSDGSNLLVVTYGQKDSLDYKTVNYSDEIRNVLSKIHRIDDTTPRINRSISKLPHLTKGQLDEAPVEKAKRAHLKQIKSRLTFKRKKLLEDLHGKMIKDILSTGCGTILVDRVKPGNWRKGGVWSYGVGSLITELIERATSIGVEATESESKHSSHLCMECGKVHIVPKGDDGKKARDVSRPSRETWLCPHCGFMIDNDVNSAESRRRLACGLLPTSVIPPGLEKMRAILKAA